MEENGVCISHFERNGVAFLEMALKPLGKVTTQLVVIERQMAQIVAAHTGGGE